MCVGGREVHVCVGEGCMCVWERDACVWEGGGWMCVGGGGCMCVYVCSFPVQKYVGGLLTHC